MPLIVNLFLVGIVVLIANLSRYHMLGSHGDVITTVVVIAVILFALLPRFRRGRRRWDASDEQSADGPESGWSWFTGGGEGHHGTDGGHGSGGHDGGGSGGDGGGGHGD